jgi:hypothetical protein
MQFIQTKSLNMKRTELSCLLTFAGFASILCVVNANAGPNLDYNRDILPILSKNCYACHGPDSKSRTTKMRLDKRESAIAKHKSGDAPIVPGKPEASELIRRVKSEDEADHMPPKETGIRLSPEQIDKLSHWIGEGANYTEHWAFVKPVQKALPAVNDPKWPRNGIDYFVLAKLQAAGLQPTPEADRFTLLRRASLDLRGLPPTMREIEEFAKGQSQDAYEKTVDRFLQDAAYGERWARMWLDLARYADSAGYGSDPLRPILWRWRDWVIDAFNNNMPFDQFTIEQLAGDLLPNPTLDEKIATSFHRNTMTNKEGGTNDEEWRVAAVKDRIDSTMQIWMGLTLGCAKCHSHKYDPITQKEYYRFYAIFNQTADANHGDESPTIPAPTPQMMERNRRIDAQIAELKRQLDAPTPQKIAGRILGHGVVPPPYVLLAYSRMSRIEKSRPAVPNLPVMVELPADKRRETHLMNKGNYLDKGDKVEPGLPSSLPPLPAGAPMNRLGVAQWLVSPDNPLTARVAVNRYWAQLFGIGLVRTEEDFGSQGELPSHPELLDWLAVEYMKTGWDTKALLRLLVTSATYRQSSKVSPEMAEKDPQNRLLARGPRFRLEAEMVRDQALALSGLLSRKMHGPSVYPPQPDGLWQAAFNGERTWSTSPGQDRHRRGLYTFWRRTVPYPSMAAFDAPSRETCTIRRIRTNTPLQAFVTLNDPVYVECAQSLARRILTEGGATNEERARFALTLCLAHPPREEHLKQVLALVQSETEHYRKQQKDAEKLATDPLGPLPQGMDAAEAAAWTVVANVLLNLDGVLTKG